MEQEDMKLWDKTINELMEMPPQKRKHFAAMIMALAKCYIDNNTNKAVVLINNEDALVTFCAGADEYDAAQIVQMANDVLCGVVTADAPPKEMFN